MALHAAFLRGINLGRRRIRMDELRAHVAAFGLEDVDTYRASGNVIFSHPGGALQDLERELEAHLQGPLGYAVPTFVRPLEELGDMVGHGLVASARQEGFTPYVVFCRHRLDEAARESLRALETPDDRFRVHRSEVYFLRRGRVSDSPVKPRHLERALGSDDWTRRKLTTVEGILEKFGS